MALETAQISLENEFEMGTVEDVALWESSGAAIFFLAKQSVPGEIVVKTLSFAVPHRMAASSNDQKSKGLPSSLLTSPVVTGLVGKQETLFGSGPITVAKDPRTALPILLSWEQSRQLLHEYEISPQGKLSFRGSLQLKGVTKVDSLIASPERPDKFDIVSENSKKSFSLLKLYIGRSLRRVELTSAAINENANIWTKNLLFFGIMGQAIDLLDEAFGNDWITTESIINDENINLFAQTKDIHPQKALDILYREGILPQLEYEELKREHTIESDRGYKWSGIVVILASFYVWNKLKSRYARMGKIHNQMAKKIRSSLTKSLSYLGLSSKYISKITIGIDKKQRSWKGRMLRNYYNSQRPVREIKKLEHSLSKICKKLKTPGCHDVLAALKANKKIKRLKDRTQNLLEITNTSQVDDIVKQFHQEFVANSRVERWRQKLQAVAMSQENLPRLWQSEGWTSEVMGRRLGTRIYHLIDKFYPSLSRQIHSSAKS